MKKFLLISYWILAIVLVASILYSLGYKFSEAVFIGTAFLPGALALKYFFPKTSSPDKRTRLQNQAYLCLGIIVAEIFIILLAHLFISSVRTDFPKVLTNPVFIAVIIAILCIGYIFVERVLDKRYPAGSETISFLSKRKPVKLKISEILYIESNDSITTVYATDDRTFRNKTPISQWEANLGAQFIRSHRSFLVNKNVITKIESDTIHIGDTELPISRKYRDAVHQI